MCYTRCVNVSNQVNPLTNDERTDMENLVATYMTWISHGANLTLYGANLTAMPHGQLAVVHLLPVQTKKLACCEQ